MTHRRPEEMDPEERHLYETITGGVRASQARLSPLVDEEGCLLGPFEAMLRSPRIGGALQGLGAAIRYECSLGRRVTEMAILAVAARWGSSYELYVHERTGRAEGLSDKEIAQLRAGEPPELTDPVERAAMLVIGAVLRDGDLGDDDYREALGQLGERGIFELTTLAGYYSTLALQLRVFRVALPA